MPLKIAAKRANKIKLVDGFATAKISNIIYKEECERTNRDGEIFTQGEQFEWIFEVVGANGVITMREWTYTRINSEKFSVTINNETMTDYNKLTRLLLNLGVLSEENLDNSEDLDISNCIGIEFKFKPIKSLKSNFSDVDFRSITVV